MRLSLVGTVHAETGLANVVELLAILERLKPDVIFAEIPSADIDEYSNGSRGSLESMAVARYRDSHQIPIIPVDLAKPEDAFFRDSEEMFVKVSRASPKYRRMVDRNSEDTRVGGFSYLNSDHCIQTWMNIYGEVLDTLNWIQRPRLHEIYDLWTRQNELREAAWVQSIANFGVRSGCMHGVFLVGAAHSKSLIPKARASLGNGLDRVDWGWGALFVEHT